MVVYVNVSIHNGKGVLIVTHMKLLCIMHKFPPIPEDKTRQEELKQEERLNDESGYWKLSLV